MLESSKSSKSVAIYSIKTGEKLCNIEAPQKWWAGLSIPIRFATVAYYKGWKDPEAIKKWAWQQAFVVVSYLNVIRDTEETVTIPPDFSCPCLICEQNTVVYFVGHLRWFGIDLGKRKPWGFACSNQMCNVYNVFIPLVLCERIDEIPPEYLPKPDSEQS